MDKRLYRSCNNKVISGVCGGIGDYFAVDPVIIRIIFIIAFIIFHIFTFLIYIVLWIILPCEKTGEVKTEEQKNTDEKEKSNTGSTSATVIIALTLILFGIFFLIPGSFFRFGDIAAFLIAFFLILIALKIAYEMIRDQDYSLMKLSAAFIILSYTLFIILNRLSIIDSGIYFEYAKNLLPAILILLGIGIIFKNIGNKILPLILGSLVFIFIWTYSFINGNYTPSGFMERVMEGWRFPNFNWNGRWHNNYRKGFSNFGISNFSGTYNLPEGIDSLVFKIENSGGNLNIKDTENLMEYRSDGISPNISTNINNKIFTVEFSNHASDSRLKLNHLKGADIYITVSAGNLEGDLRNMNIQTLNVILNGGSVDLKLGENTKPGSRVMPVNVENNIGSTTISLPKKAKIKIKVDTALAHIGIPDEFENINGEYIYNGGNQEIDITAKVNMGNLEFQF